MSSATIFIILFAVASLLVIWIGGRLFIQYRSPMPSGLGVRDGQLASCPETPNCISTQAPEEDEVHRIGPLPLEGNADQARQRLIEIIEQMPRSKIIASEPNYIHAEFRSLTWGFVDDVEFFLHEENDLIHSRSAARLGGDDFGVNRNRYEAIRRAFES